MKTIDEAAQEFADNNCLNDGLHKSIFKSGFTICAKQFANRWISVEEDLPEEPRLVFTKDIRGIYSAAKYYGKLENNRNWWKDQYGHTYYDITHWRPIDLK